MINKEFFEAVDLLAQEKGITAEEVYNQLGDAIERTVANQYFNHNKEIVHCDINPEKQTLDIYATKEVVEEVTNKYTELTLEEGQAIRKNARIGSVMKIKINPKDLNRQIVTSAKATIRSIIRAAEKTAAINELKNSEQEIVSAKVISVSPTGDAMIQIGKHRVPLGEKSQIPGEVLKPDDIIKVFVVGVFDNKENQKGSPRLVISRAHPGMVRRLFESEVPEIFDGIIKIESVAREPGSRTKIAVSSSDPDVEPVGSCIGPRGQRVNTVVESLGGEKIDIVRYSDDPVEYVSAALAPSDVIEVEILDEAEKSCRATVPEDMLSLAIGSKGQNVRLAARLTGWKIDIKSAPTYN